MKRSASRLISTLLALCMALALLPGTALALHGESDIVYPVTGGNIYFDPATGTVTDCDKSVTAAIIPREIGGVPVTEIGICAFFDCAGLTEVTIPDGVTIISERAFQSCGSLKEVTIPDSVTSIAEGAFCNCYSLTGIHVNSGNSTYISVDGVLFSADRTLLHTYPAGKSDPSYVIPVSVNRIGMGAFDDCRSLTGVMTIPDGVTIIPVCAFSSCRGLTDVIIPDSVITIGDSAFDDCKSLTSVIIPGSVTEIGYGAFFGCSSLTDVTIPTGITFIDAHTFEFCSSLRDIYYGGSRNQWKQVVIIKKGIKGEPVNASLLNAVIHYNSAGPDSVAEVSVTVGGKAVVWTDAAPFIDENDRTMVPLRAVADAMGLAVDWNAAAREAVFTDGSKTICFPIGSTTARTGGGGSVEMDTAAVIKKNRSYAPIRYLAEYFGYEVGWDAATRTVIIR